VRKDMQSLNTLRSMLTVEGLHRTRESFDYKGCDHSPCPWCRHIRHWAAFKMEELGVEDLDDEPRNCSFDYLGDICRQCAKARQGYAQPGHASTARKSSCSQCKQERMVSHWSNFVWGDIHRDFNAREIRKSRK